MQSKTTRSGTAALYLAIVLGIGCTPVKESDGQAIQGTNGWTVERSFIKEIANCTFLFPPEGYAYALRDSLVDACMDAM